MTVRLKEARERKASGENWDYQERVAYLDQKGHQDQWAKRDNTDFQEFLERKGTRV